VRTFSAAAAAPAKGGAKMADEYGNMDSSGQTAVVDEFVLDSGKAMHKVELNYMTWGELNDQRNNVIVICHALTGNADAGSWWGALVGPGRPIDTRKYFVFCSNALGSCYGTTGPTSLNPDTGKKYGGDFPAITIRDMVRLQAEVLTQMGVSEVACVIGGSMGGMLTMEWGAEIKNIRVRSLISMASGGRHQPWQIAISECQRAAIRADPKFLGGHYAPEAAPTDGLAVARMMAMVTYRTHPKYWDKFGRVSGGKARKVAAENVPVFDVEKYLRYQGKMFHKRGFDAMAYIVLTQAMDAHDLGRRRGEYTEVLRSMKMPALIVSISSDVLYPPSDQRELAQHMPNAQFHLIQSDEGHDGFILETPRICPIVRGFLEELEVSSDA
jgi:homoserine O-acetyltransferase